MENQIMSSDNTMNNVCALNDGVNASGVDVMQENVEAGGFVAISTNQEATIAQVAAAREGDVVKFEHVDDTIQVEKVSVEADGEGEGAVATAAATTQDVGTTSEATGLTNNEEEMEIGMAGAAAVVNTNTVAKTTTTTAIDCPICLLTCVHPTRLPCGHIFCFLCIKGLDYNNRRCALCRRDIPTEYLEYPQLVNGIEDITSVRTTEDGYQWFYEGRNGWWQYDERSSQEIEEAFKLGKSSCKIMLFGYAYVIDLEVMTQQNENDPTRIRLIKRDLATTAKRGIAGLRIEGNAVIADNINPPRLSVEVEEPLSVEVPIQMVPTFSAPAVIRDSLNGIEAGIILAINTCGTSLTRFNQSPNHRGLSAIDSQPEEEEEEEVVDVYNENFALTEMFDDQLGVDDFDDSEVVDTGENEILETAAGICLNGAPWRLSNCYIHNMPFFPNYLDESDTFPFYRE